MELLQETFPLGICEYYFGQMVSFWLESGTCGGTIVTPKVPLQVFQCQCGPLVFQHTNY